MSSPILSSLALAAMAATAATAANVDYLRDVKPLLTQHCVRCHGDGKEEAGLRADTAEALKAGGDNGPTTRAKGDGESLLLQVVMGTHDDIPRMPYKKPALSAEEIAVLRAWVAAGAPAPKDEEPGRFMHWAFVAPKHFAPPEVKRSDWPRNAIDRFVLARLEKENIAPSPEADRVTLLRRVTLDLIGLPPTPAEIDAFLKDKQPDAYDRVVERLLASPHYGERWARPWLDVARYADSNGYSIDAPRQIWKYRDWVVNAFNRNLPFDQFVIDQLAGDLLPKPTIEQKVATGFNRNTQINQEGGIDPEQFRIESVMDRVNTLGSGFLGLTVGCAQCHDHKFDPISQKDYYSTFAFFNNTVDDGHGKNTPGGLLEFKGEFEARESQQRLLEEANEDLERYLNTKGGEVTKWMADLDDEGRKKVRSPSARAALKTSWDKQTLAQKRAVYGAFRTDDDDFKTRDLKVRDLAKAPKPISTLIMAEMDNPRESFIFIKGDFTRHGDPVKPATLSALPPLRLDDPNRTPNRLDLAKWLMEPTNPLTARVFVNRMWQQYFGRGIVETENDFGTQGSPPSHPELLDWLATEFMAQMWDIKAMHRLIVTSATYRQSSHARPDLEISDPINKLLARQSRLRLDAEIVRDVSLAASGLLVPKLGGAPVYPPQPDGVMNLGQVKRAWNTSKGDDRYRRGLYTHYQRATPHPALAVFDASDSFSACTRRIRSNTPLQALTLLNDQQFFEFAEALGKRVRAEARGELPAQLEYAFRLCMARSPTATERDRLVALYQQQFAASTGDDAAKQAEAWTTVARVLLNLDETITRE